MIQHWGGEDGNEEQIGRLKVFPFRQEIEQILHFNASYEKKVRELFITLKEKYRLIDAKVLNNINILLIAIMMTVDVG